MNVRRAKRNITAGGHHIGANIQITIVGIMNLTGFVDTCEPETYRTDGAIDIRPEIYNAYSFGVVR